MMTIPEISLNDGATLPAIGLGTYRLNGAAGAKSIESGIRAGFRLVDTAFSYENEGAVGEAIRRAGVPRSELRVCSKLPGHNHRYKQAITTIEESLFRAQLDHYDLYLIHWPNPSKGLYVEAWSALIEARKRGLVRSIGVSNFLPEHLGKLIDQTGVTPAVNQVELHPGFPQVEQCAWHRENGIVTKSWSPLGGASGDRFHHGVIRAIAERLERTTAQVILRWHVQNGSIPIPKAASAGRQAENLAIFDFSLADEDMELISTLARPDGRIANQDPARFEELVYGLRRASRSEQLLGLIDRVRRSR